MKRRERKADSCKLTAAAAAAGKENCAAAQEKQLTMLQVAVAAATAPTPVVAVVASSCHCSWLWFSDCIAQDFNTTVFARRVRGEDKRSRKGGLASLHMLAAAHACKHKTQSQSQTQQHRQL